eukprot:Skav232835  [mRNA]  locus=scaffold2600:288497:293646:+ [translate_table: standard]
MALLTSLLSPRCYATGTAIPRLPSVDLRELEPKTLEDHAPSAGDEASTDQTLHDALQESLDSMTGACTRLRGDDMVSVIEDGEMTVLAFAPPMRLEEQEIVGGSG